MGGLVVMSPCFVSDLEVSEHLVHFSMMLTTDEKARDQKRAGQGFGFTPGGLGHGMALML